MTKIDVPSKLLNLITNDDIECYIENIIKNCEKSEYFVSEHPYFFPEYTKHGCEHVNKVLYYISVLIPENNTISSEDIATTILGAIFHDAGMFINSRVFVRLLNDSNFFVFDGTKEEELTFSESFLNYIEEVRNWFAGRKVQVFGKLYNEDVVISLRDWNSIGDFGSDFVRLFIGEFIRRFHHEIALRLIETGFNNDGDEHFGLKEGDVARKLVKLIGIVAYSHGVSLKNAEKKIADLSLADKQTPYGVHIYYAMSLVRLADYLDAGVERASMFYLNNNVKYSAYSKDEFVWNQCVTSIELSTERKDELAIEISYEEIPNPTIYNKLQRWVEDLNSELDTCWAVLGRKHYDNCSGFAIRNIASNILDVNQYINSKACKFYPKPLSISFNNELLYTLAKRLYDNDQYCGIRELLQNSVDACRELKAIWSAPETYKPQVSITYNNKTGELLFCDNGVGMDIECIEKCYLSVGKSFSNLENTPNAEIYKTGQFGIGFLAAFLLSDEVKVETKRYTHNSKFLSFSYSINNSNNIEVNVTSNHRFYGTQIRMIVREIDRAYVTSELKSIGNALVNTDVNIQVCILGTEECTYNSCEDDSLWYTAYLQPGYKILFRYCESDNSDSRYTYYNGVPYKDVLTDWIYPNIIVGFVDLHRHIAFSINRSEILRYKGLSELLNAIEENRIAQMCHETTPIKIKKSFIFPDGYLVGMRGREITIVVLNLFATSKYKNFIDQVTNDTLSIMLTKLKEQSFYESYYGVHIDMMPYDVISIYKDWHLLFTIGDIEFYSNAQLCVYSIPTIVSSICIQPDESIFRLTSHVVELLAGTSYEEAHFVPDDMLQEIKEDPEKYVAQFKDSLIPFDHEALQTKFPFINTQNTSYYNFNTSE